MDGIEKPTIRKAFAYITRNNKLLVFEQPESPEAGIQVPAGSIEANESPEAGTLREAQEETGLECLTVIQFLGEHTVDVTPYGKSEIHHRYFYHLTCDQKTPDTWQHGECFPSDKADHDGNFRHIFRFYWVSLDAVPELVAEMDFYVDRLRGIVGANQNGTSQE